MLKKNMEIKEIFYEINDFDFNQYKNYFESITAIGLLEYLDDKETILFLNQMEIILNPLEN